MLNSVVNSLRGSLDTPAVNVLDGGASFFGKQVVAALVCSLWAFCFTYAMLWLINRITVVKVDPLAEERGLDAELHGEEAYPLGA